MEIVILWLLLGIGVGVLANSRGRSGFGYFLLAVVLSPLIGLIVVLVADDLIKKAEMERQAERDHERRLEEVRALASRPSNASRMPTAGSSTRAGGSASVADELAKLADLRERGVLTPEEFQVQKMAVLSSARSEPVEQSMNDAAAREEERLLALKPKGTCPNCKKTIPLDSEKCGCGAKFSGVGWKVLPLA